MNIEFRLIDTKDMPPLVISMTETGEPKVVINTYHRVWISLHRRTIAGIIDALQEKMDMILSSYLEEQLNFINLDREQMEE
tara:strand:- start:1887 stop:2129 length:243 start_codon:yes stop_codon:yes gene_type:complete